MRYIFKLLFLLFIIIELAMNSDTPYIQIALLLAIAGVNVLNERFYNSVYLAAVSFVLIAYGTWLNSSFGILLCISVFDFIYYKVYPGIFPVIGITLFLMPGPTLPSILLSIATCGILAYVIQKSVQTQATYKGILDKERRLRYELEQAKDKLLHSSREIAHLAETRERNRIAREIHDNAGHNLTGILIQLQAALKLFDRDSEKSKSMLHGSIESLSQTVTLIRDTVHNIKPKESLGVEYIKNVIDNFRFCPVNFSSTGDFSQIPANHLEILASNIKEALTNAARHSKATTVDISIDINEKIIRLYIKDNGTGCDKIKEGLGISSMKDRVRNVGGSISLSGDKGFLIVCVIPREENAIA